MLLFDKRLIPSFFSSPKILTYPQAFSLASIITNWRISSRVLGLPRLLTFLVLFFVYIFGPKEEKFHILR